MAQILLELARSFDMPMIKIAKVRAKDGNRRTMRNRQGEGEFQDKKGERRRTKRRISPYLPVNMSHVRRP